MYWASIVCQALCQIGGCQTFWSQDPLILLKIIEDFQELLFIGIIYIDIFHVKTENGENILKYIYF